MKIISLVPSITETLFDLGLTENEVIGRTKFCIHPSEKVKKIEIIGGTKNLNIDKIKSLKPDIILANKEENVKDQVESLMQDFRVEVFDTETLKDNYQLVKTLGSLFGKQEAAQIFNEKIKNVLDQFKIKSPIKAAYLIWKNPYMTVGSDTFIHHVLAEIGFENLFKDQTRYPEITADDLADAGVIMLSSEPFPFKEKHIDELRTMFPEKKIMIVDGEAFSWYGTHIAKCEDYFRNLIAEFA
ncbi:iron ABC transporter [Chryseobacterium sp. Leaf180]|uniref:ABC transporter substrate-binding protein n=1 Tax=Chryseobacterium sp. Leaf180 TaxID=1736289 RepID=UPI0006FB0E6E|nr:helical backbone metal receptor [Chryseobacterium sp. Leaf180]KQR93273.1 iron ABC transporter [Chryseobacterium sp. Leaf180]